MHKIIKTILVVAGILVLTIALLFGVLLYRTNYKAAVVDTARSLDGKYELILQSIGEPHFPFGAAPGRLILKTEETIVAQESFEIANDGGPFSANDWSVTWYDDRVEVILSGEEQYDELVALYYDGQAEHSSLTTHNGVETKGASDEHAETQAKAESASEAELFSEERQITAGYQAIYALYAANLPDRFAVNYGASERTTRCVFSENEACGLYVLYRSVKKDDGTWSDEDGTMLDCYAYVLESGDVISSGKIQWDDAGSEEYQKAVTEK